MMVVLIFAFAASVFALTPGELSRVTLEQHPGRATIARFGFPRRKCSAVSFREFDCKTTDCCCSRDTIAARCFARLINDGLIQALQEFADERRT